MCMKSYNGLKYIQPLCQSKNEKELKESKTCKKQGVWWLRFNMSLLQRSFLNLTNCQLTWPPLYLYSLGVYTSERQLNMKPTWCGWVYAPFPLFSCISLMSLHQGSTRCPLNQERDPRTLSLTHDRVLIWIIVYTVSAFGDGGTTSMRSFRREGFLFRTALSLSLVSVPGT